LGRFSKASIMKWVGISGSWRMTSQEVEQDIEREVTYILASGHGVVTGGALGVDYLATDIALKRFPDGSHIQVFLPTSLESYARHYRKRANEGAITTAQAEKLIEQLEALQKLHALTENPTVSAVNMDSYYQRNSAVIAASNELVAFQVNNSAGTQDTIDKAKSKGISTRVFRYSIQP
jgi:predicted Rossmann fold nucleotide-binding protein DprA/Smf involved in DNA uptake